MRRRCCKGSIACAVLGVALLNPRRASAQELGPTLLSYRAPEGCPSAADFQRSVQRRSARVRFVDQGAHDRELSIAMRADANFTSGELRLVEADGSQRRRSVRFTTCAEAVEGLALIAVMSLDPQALLPSAEPAAKPTEPAPAAGPKPAPKPPEPAPAPTPRPVPPKVPPRADSGAPRPSKLQFALGAEFTVAPSALPETALGGSLFVDIASSSRAWSAPLLRIAASHVERRGLASSAGAEAHFALSLATLSACPLQLAGGFLALRPCAFASAGMLAAWGSQTTNLQQRTRPFGALGGSLLLFARASQAVEIVADLAAGGSLVRDRFGFGQDDAWKTPAFYVSSGLGARFVFP